MSAASNPDLLIEIDGGVSESNAAELVAAGANVLVAGNSVFSAADPLNAIAQLKTLS
jgi:ribulose-phosphate 3-epimerase